MTKTLKENVFYLIPYVIIVIIILTVLLLYNKAEIHIFMNSYHSSFFDFFFRYWTHLGDGIFAAVFTFALLFIKYKWALISGIANVLTALFVQLSKRILFSDHIRPKFFFDYFYPEKYDLYLINGVNPGIHSSFPSGHTATAFVIFFLLAMIINKNYLKILFLIASLLVAYSRIYLSWHFLKDTLAGSLIGLIITLIVFILINKKTAEWHEKSLVYKIKIKSDK